jgi:hypothetical protein
VKKYRFYLDLENEEKWLTEMAKQGLGLSRKTVFGYEFRQIPPQDTVIRIDYRNFNTPADFEDYRMLFKDSGWEHVAGTKSSGIQYFKKVSTKGDAEIFSDTTSKAARYRRLSSLWLSLALAYVPLLISLIYSGIVDPSAFLNPKLLYYTPGLWDMTGQSFLNAFLFETPFAIIRGLSWFIFPASICLCIASTVKLEMLYHRSKHE